MVRPRILVVDDDPKVLSLMDRGLAFEGYDVDVASDGADALNIARERPPHLVVLDVMMPGIDGFALCRSLKSDPETDYIPVILLTARASTEDRVAGLMGGADDYLAKPFEVRELEARVDNLIASRQRLRERFAGMRVELPAAPQPSGLAPDDQAFVDRLHATIAEQLTEPGFGVSELASQLFMDRSNLFRRARELVGETPSDLIRRLRLERAAELLRDGSGTVAEVAYAVGFQSVSHFSQRFREANALSPSEYRDRARVASSR